ncbi:hypothetical protein BSPWISOX_3011 [uncultured Gammaproteobacteria bacterium]|nr:hypothetical protein BSPWISOX_3011 [uncultured Gammaproteobacteria bacterium]
MLADLTYQQGVPKIVSVAGCLGYDVLVLSQQVADCNGDVSVAGCLGYDVLVWLKTLI